jgi:polar amino acid transport system substrate-binding protein
MSTRQLIKLFVFLLIIFSLNSVYAKEQLQLPLVTGEWPPFTSKQMDGKGFFTELVTAIMAEMKLKPHYQFLPWKRCESRIVKGSAWGAFPYSKNEARSKKYNFSDTVAYSTTVFFYYKPRMKHFAYSRIEDLKKYKIGGVLGYFYQEEFDKEKLNVEYVTTDEQNIKKLFVERFDITPINELVGWQLVKKLYPDKINEFATAKKFYNDTDLRVMVYRKYPDSDLLLKRFNEGLQLIKSKGVLNQIYKKYGLTVRK